MYAMQRYGHGYKNCSSHLPHYCFLVDAEATGYPVGHKPHVGDLWLAPCDDLKWVNGATRWAVAPNLGGSLATSKRSTPTARSSRAGAVATRPQTRASGPHGFPAPWTSTRFSSTSFTLVPGVRARSVSGAAPGR